MNGIVKIQLWQFILIYLLLIIVWVILYICRVNLSLLLV